MSAIDDNREFDVAIVGGGPAGTATGIALQNIGVGRVFLAEAGSYSKPKIGESIPPDTRKLFQRLNIADAFEQQDHEPCLGSFSSWGSAQLGFNDNLFNPYGAGWHLDRRRFDQFMADQFKQRGGHLACETRFASVSVEHNTPYPLQLSFDDQPPVRCRFVVDATGQSAIVARRFGAQPKMQDTMLSIAAYFDCKDTDLNTLKLTLLEAIDLGWWYCASIPNNQLVVSLTTDAHIAKEHGLKDPKNWFALLHQSTHVAERVHSLAPPAHLHYWKTPSSLLNPPAGNGWLAVGDAASCYDPISSQGVYKALATGLKAAHAIADWLDNKPTTLAKYRQYIGNEFINYLSQREYFYQQEQRWYEAAFWLQRRAS
ncbi:tryptophan 7-halogenase [Pseudoalteromonas sp. McH1-42]|uniref:tryptophan 7-halogenase n=1 Tax=Pseudoalteromonas sp. McH1-42 TaxID=2917752 RepID=UPI001EF4E1B0|nr:tryptophan 7-halogenase [Pseudoalteromonas sp. McH1-42]MCG7561280.1 tryptophan 7-halogenase [Pseudoalteromonas sp. McH1-42]